MGLLLQMPADFMRDRARDLLGRELKSTYAVGMVFMSTDADSQTRSERPLLSLRLNLISQ